MISLILTISFVGLMFLRVPVSFAIGLSTLIAIVCMGKDMIAIPQYMIHGVTSVPLLAVPFFILAANLFDSLGLSRRIWDFALSVVGHLRGGMGQVMVLANMIFAGLSGSSLADAAGLGVIGIPAMEKQGYRRPFSTAISLCSAVLGPMIPPSINLILYGVIVQASIGRLFLAGIIPGIIIGSSLMATVYYYAARGLEPLPIMPRRSVQEMGKSFIWNLPAIIVPVIILIGMVSGIITPTEVGILAAFYSLVLGFFYRKFSYKHIVQSLGKSAISTCLIMYIIAVSTVAGWIYALEGTPQKLAELMLDMTNNKYIVLLCINVFILILGCLLEPVPVLLITTPILLPILIQLDIDLVHFGIVINLNTTMGIITPPMGIGLYVMQGIVDIKFEDLVRASAPFLIPLILCLMLFTYVPELSLFLPNLIFGKP